jgi:hypothetical protein
MVENESYVQRSNPLQYSIKTLNKKMAEAVGQTEGGVPQAKQEGAFSAIDRMYDNFENSAAEHKAG